MSAVLALDTSSPVLSLALKDAEGKIHVSSVEGLMNHAEQILPQIDALFKKSRTSFSNLSAFLIGRGPGSFTGLRVGFATVKGFLAGSDALSTPCYGALSLDLIAESSFFKNLPEGAQLAVTLDAFRERIYFRLYRQLKGNWTAAKAPEILSIEETLKTIPEGAHVTGNALGKYSDAFKSIPASRKVRLEPETHWYPPAEALIDLYERKDPKLEKLARHELLPFYFRLSEAEERLKADAPAC